MMIGEDKIILFNMGGINANVFQDGPWFAPHRLDAFVDPL